MTNKGVILEASQSAVVEKVVDIAGHHFRNVPVLVIASSRDELKTIYEAL